jgi:hypothetical protein
LSQMFCFSYQKQAAEPVIEPNQKIFESIKSCCEGIECENSKKKGVVLKEIIATLYVTF